MDINELPPELADIIFSYIPDADKLRLNKYYYNKYHGIVLEKLIKKNSESYIRYMVRKDNNFIINYLLKERYNRWINFANYYYKGLEFDNYICFLKYYASECNSKKCEDEILKYSQNGMENK